jgi:hypothetical protein
MAKNTNLSQRPPNLFPVLGLLSNILLNLSHINGVKRNQIKLKIEGFSKNTYVAMANFENL